MTPQVLGAGVPSSLQSLSLLWMIVLRHLRVRFVAMRCFSSPCTAEGEVPDMCHVGAGAIRGNLGLTQDWRGHAREVFAASGTVAADHGRCSDIGEQSIAAESQVFLWYICAAKNWSLPWKLTSAGKVSCLVLCRDAGPTRWRERSRCCCCNNTVPGGDESHGQRHGRGRLHSHKDSKW